MQQADKPLAVAVLAFDGVIPFDLTTPCETFGRLRLSGAAAYRVRVCSPKRHVDAGGFAIRTEYGLSELVRAHTVIVPGISDLSQPIPPKLIVALQAAAARGARVASICTGSFLLAAAGLLDGLSATTHWMAAPELARRHPRVNVLPDVLYVDNGQVLTSAGAAAGIDLCLYLIRRDFGASAAAHAARLAVMPLEREGGQKQFIVHERPTADGAWLDRVLRFIDKNLEADLSLDVLARRASLSTRSLNRRFVEQVGTTPARYVLTRRIRRAQVLLETSTEPVEAIALTAGFGSPAAFRERFRAEVGTSPRAYRQSFRGNGA